MQSVLIIDDSVSIRLYLKCVLEEKHYHVYEASNGKEGYQLFREVSPDYIIIDIFMPEMDGIETIQKIMSHNQKARIIVISGGGSIQEMPYFDICKRFGVACCLSKPIKKELLLDSLKELE